MEEGRREGECAGVGGERGRRRTGEERGRVCRGRRRRLWRKEDRGGERERREKRG